MKTTDSQSGYRAYSRRAIEEIKIRNPNMGAGSEILTQGRGLQFNRGGDSDKYEIWY